MPATPDLGGEIVIAAAGDNLLTMGSTVSMAFLGMGANTLQGGSTQEYIATESGPSTMDRATIQAYLAPLIARHKMPQDIMMVEIMPLTLSGTIQKFTLRDECMKRQQSAEPSRP